MLCDNVKRDKLIILFDELVVRFKTEEEAVAVANDTSAGLAGMFLISKDLLSILFPLSFYFI